MTSKYTWSIVEVEGGFEAKGVAPDGSIQRFFDNRSDAESFCSMSDEDRVAEDSHEARSYTFRGRGVHS